MMHTDNQQGQDSGALAAGFVVADKVVVTPKSVQSGDTIHITAFFRNESWFPAYAVLEVKLDGLIIDTYCTTLSCSVIFGPKETVTWELDYTLPTSVSSGLHRIEALEQEQVVPAYEDFEVVSPPPPGQRNVSFTSVPAGAQIFIGTAYYGDTPITIPLAPGIYEVKAVYSGQELTRNIQVIAGSGSQAVQFAFTQEKPFDLTKWLSDNKWYVGGAVVLLGGLYLVIKKPATVRQGLSAARTYAEAGYRKAQEAYKEVSK